MYTSLSNLKILSWNKVIRKDKLISLTLELRDQICNSPYCQLYNCYDVSSENLVLVQLIIFKLIFSFVLITYLVDIVLIL